ncbi:protein GAMETOPHYTE DEFECTIVE 1 [Humulus lupulus]|uniref:protein GAMETOPHYTE DEFECTIVE 1 n=1 Tax=Humulus lupulus TaxID=3486 RepID=UPI002B416146|nr:protein GAMETOPHYTE DEFECTIVE 1 [Humulus lupulus]
MGFFDFNIPYSEALPSDKATRIKLATMAMELGYSGVAYNRTIKGVMSDRDRCSIPLLTLSSLLKLSPSLASSVYFHRDLLGVPRASPFRQYTRLTVNADSPSQAQVLNSGNPILKTYDLVSVRPLNQTIFDQACERLEVDIIAIDFSEKLPFRLKLPMVKAAIQRGVFFEITYSNLITDIQARRQMITNAKLLVDWTRGKNLIISSAASSVFELRGPYDVANLSFLLGLALEQAKAAVSKNCRALITKALRKKQFHKDAIKVEVISSGEQVESNKPWSSDLFKWDPISSGDGDLLLEDLEKSFAASNNVSKNSKAIDFTSIIGSLPSHGFQVRDLISGDSHDNSKNVHFVAEATALPVLRDGDLEQRNRLDLPKPSVTSMYEALFKQQSFGNQNSQVLYSTDTTKVLPDSIEIGSLTTSMKAETSNPNAIDDLMNEDLLIQEASLPLNNLALHEEEQSEKPGFVPLLEDNSPVANCEPLDAKMEDQIDAECSHLSLVRSSPVELKAKRKMRRQALLLPLKRRLSTSPFKKKSHKSKRKN